MHWRWASSNNHIKDYKGYLESWPRGRHVAQAKSSIDELYWKEANRAYTVVSFKRYLSRYPAGNHAAQAEANIIALQVAVNQDTQPIEGTVETVDETAGTLKIRTPMDELEVLRITDDTFWLNKKEINES